MKPKLLIGSVAAILCVFAIWRFIPDRSPKLGKLDGRMEKLRSDGDVEALGKEIESSDIPTARRAVESLGHAGPKAVKLIRKALGDPRPQIRQKAAIAYARAADIREIAPLTEVARTDESSIVRASAVTALGRVRAYEEMETLLDAMNDDDIIVRRRAAEAVVDIIGRRYPYKANARPAQRLKSIAVIRKFWVRAKRSAGRYYDDKRRRLKEAAKKSQ